MEEGKRSCVHSHFLLGSSPFRLPFLVSCASHFIGFTNSNQWLLEEGGEKLASEIKGMILDFIRGVHAVYFRWQNDLSHIIV